MANRYMKICSALLIVREIPFKTTVNYHSHTIECLLSRRKAISGVDRMWRNRHPPALHCWGCDDAATSNTAWQLLKRLRTEDHRTQEFQSQKEAQKNRKQTFKQKFVHEYLSQH